MTSDRKAQLSQTCARLSTDNTTLADGIAQHVLKCSIRDGIDVWRQTAANSYLRVLLTLLLKFNTNTNTHMHVTYNTGVWYRWRLCRARGARAPPNILALGLIKPTAITICMESSDNCIFHKYCVLGMCFKVPQKTKTARWLQLCPIPTG